MDRLPPAIREQAAQVDAIEKAAVTEAQVDTSTQATAPATPAAPAAPAAPAVNPDDFAKLQHQFQTLQGMWRAEKERNAEMEDRLRALEQPAKSAAPAPSDELVLPVTENDREAFGADLCQFVANQVNAATGHVLGAFEARMAKIEAQLGETKTVVAATAEDTREVRWQEFLKKLDGKVAGWFEMQGTAEGKQFLGMRVPGAKHTWNDILRQAAADMDADAAAEVFNELLKLHPQLRNTAPAAPKSPGQDPLETEVAPGPGDGGGPPPGPPGKRTYKAKEYEAETMRVVRLRQSRKDQEADALEAELDLALRENRVVP